MHFSRYIPAVWALSFLISFSSNPKPKSPVKPVPPSPREELRGLWVARWSLNSPSAVRNAVRAAKRHNFNALFVQARGRGDAWYISDLEPRGEGLSDQPADFDPLALVTREAHAQGMQVHAWLNTYLTWSLPQPPKSPNHIVHAHPDWIARDNNGKCSPIPNYNTEGLFVQQSNPAVQEHLFKIFTDVARRYDVDGIHFDFVRYANSNYDFSDSTLARFKAYMQPRISDSGRQALKAHPGKLSYVHLFPKEWADWRRAQVSGLVQRISDAVHKMKPYLQVSAAVFANVDDAYTERGQDWRAWLAGGYLDALCPMAYSKDTETVAAQIKTAVAAANGRHVYAGIGSWRLPAADTAAKIARVRKLGAQGVNIFSYDGITRDGHRTDYLDYLSRSSFPSRSAPPRMRWREQRQDTSTEEK